MKKLILLALVLLTHISMEKAYSAPKKTNKPASRAQLGTNFRFNPNALQGKHQVSPNLTATVENDKYLDDLLAPRKSFNDRIEQDKLRN